MLCTSCRNGLIPKVTLVVVAVLAIVIVEKSVSSCLLLAFLLVYIQIPGLIAFSFLSKKFISTICKVEYVLHSFFLGLAILIIEFFIFSFLNLKPGFILLSPLGIIAYFLNAFIRSNKNLKVDWQQPIDIQIIIVFLIILLLDFLTQRYAFLNIEMVDAVFLHQDLSWHIGNVASLSRGYPFADFRFDGLQFYYHYFNDLILGMCKYCFGISAYDLVLKSTPILSSYVFTLGVLSLIKAASSKVITGLTIFIFSGAAIPYYILSSEDSYSLFNYHLFSNINGVAVSLASVISVFLLICRIYDLNENKLGNYLILSALVFVMTGLKGPFAVVLVAAIMFTSFTAALIGHNIRIVVKTATSVIVPFFLTYVLIIKGFENLFKESNNNRATKLSITETFSRSRLWPAFSRLIYANDKLHVLLYCLCVAIIGSIVAVGLYYIVFFWKTLFTAYGILRHSEPIKIDDVLALTAGWIGLAGFWMISHTGFSQVYFLFVSVVFIVYETVKMLECSMPKLIRIGVILIIGINIVISGNMYISSLFESITDDSIHFSVINQEGPVEETQMLTHQEFEGLQWIRNNTEFDSVITTDRIDLYNPQYPTAACDCRCFYYSAFSERQILIEGFSYSDVSKDEIKNRLKMNADIYSDDSEVSKKAAKIAGVDYIIVSKRFNKIPEGFRDPVFSNSDIAVYEA